MSKVNKVKHINLHEIENPSFLKDLKYKELDDLADDIRKEIIETTSLNGGHLSSNLGSVELTIALNRVFDFSNDRIIFDVGHQAYTYKILTGRKLDTLRKKGGISGFQKIDESPYDHFEAGHSSTSISVANGFAISRDLDGKDYNVIAFIGDASIVSGLAMEALNNVAASDHKVIIVLNDNGMSISKPAGGLGKVFARISSSAGYNRFKRRTKSSLTKTKFGRKILSFLSGFRNWFKRKVVPLTIFDTMGLTYIGPIDGHDIKAVEKALKRAKNTTKSVVVHCCTHKGKGYKYAEEDEIGYWHGVSPFNIETGEPKNMHPGYFSWSHIFADFTDEMMEKHNNAYLISPATTRGAGIDYVFNKYPDRTLDVGIAEEHAMTLSAGISKGGYHPIISIYSTFMQRAFDEISHDLARMKLDATILVDRAGLVGADGETHQGIYDVSFLVNTPNVTVTMPSNLEEAQYLYEESFNHHGPFFIRIPRTIVKSEEFKELKLEYGKMRKIKSSNSHKLAIVGIGPLFRELETLVNERKIDCALYNALYICPLNDSDIDELTKFDKIVIYDPYSTIGGLVSSLTVKLSAKQFKGVISAFSVPDVFVKQSSIEEQLEEFGLLPSQIIEKI